MYLFITGCSFLIEQQIAFGDIQDKDIKDLTDTIIIKLYNLLVRYGNLHSIVLLIKSLIHYLMNCIVDDCKINIRYDLTEDVKCILIVLDRVCRCISKSFNYGEYDADFISSILSQFLEIKATKELISENEYIFSGRLEIDYLNSKYSFAEDLNNKEE